MTDSNRVHLTDTLIAATVANLRKSGGERVEWLDEKTSLRVRISGRGAMFYWIGRGKSGKVQRHKLGEFGPAMSTLLARKEMALVKANPEASKTSAAAKKESKRAAVVGGMTITQMRDGYLARCEADGKPLSPKTAITYNVSLPYLLGDHMDRPAAALDTDTLMALVARMGHSRMVQSKHGVPIKRGNKTGATNAVKALTRLCNVYKVADPAKELREDKRLHKAGSRDGRLGMDEAKQLFAWAHWYYTQSDLAPYKRRCALMVMVSCVTGWRISTVQKWRWEEIDLAAMTTKLPGNKMGYKQTLPLWPVLADLLKPIRQKSGDVFCGPWDYGFAHEMPWQVSPHDARKALTALLLGMADQKDVHKFALELLMQHFGAVTVKHYLRTMPIPDQVRSLRATVNRVSAVFSGVIGHKRSIVACEALAVQRRKEFAVTCAAADRRQRAAKRKA